MYIQIYISKPLGHHPGILDYGLCIMHLTLTYAINIAHGTFASHYATPYTGLRILT